MPSADIIGPHLKQAFVQLITERTGLKIRDGEQDLLEKIILKRLQSVEVSPDQYYNLLASKTPEGRAAWGTLIPEITNSESFFFRDKGQFNLLKTTLFPRLIAQKRSSKTLRICSAGCSTGEEPYSIAMLLKTLIPDIEQWNVTLLGIDIDPVSVAKAKAGLYRAWSFRGVEESAKRRFFEEVNGHYRVSPTIREMITFRVVNLLRDPFGDPSLNLKEMDLILCRNVFIYFSESAIEAVLGKFYEALRPEGFLLVGHAELHGQNLSRFQVKVFEESIAYQRPSDRGLADSEGEGQVVCPPALHSEAATAQNFETLVEGRDTKMQKAALDLLRQLPADIKLARLGNRTASELILQLEENLQNLDQG